MPILVRGDVVSVERRPWDSDPSRYSHELVVRVGEYTTRYGETRGDYVRVEVAPEQWPRVGALAEGQVVEVEVRPIPKAGKRGPYIVYWVPADAGIRASKSAGTAAA